MALYHIEGTSQISWSLLVGAGSESEASETALRIVHCLCHLRESPVRDEHHRVVGSCRVIETPVQDRPDHQWAVRTLSSRGALFVSGDEGFPRRSIPRLFLGIDVSKCPQLIDVRVRQVLGPRSLCTR